MSSSLLQFFIFFGILAVFVEMCGNVHTAASSGTAETSTDPSGRKRRDVYSSEVVHVELQTTLTSAGDVEFVKIENVVGESYGDVLASAHRQIADGAEAGKVMKYLLTGVDCGEAQLFASAIKDSVSFITGGTVRCNDQITQF